MVMATLKGEAAPPNKRSTAGSRVGPPAFAHLSKCLLLLPLSCMDTRVTTGPPGLLSCTRDSLASLWTEWLLGSLFVQYVRGRCWTT